MTGLYKSRTRVGLVAIAATLAATQAFATAGYFALGYSAVQRGQAGAGVANGEDAMSSAINPAGVATVGNQMSMGLQLFAPYRGFTATGTAFIPSGTVNSDKNLFPVPNFAYNKVLANGARLNFAAYGNGGMDTTYPAVANANCVAGVYCAGAAGVDLEQLFMSVTYAQKIGGFSFGIAPTLVAQGFKANGLDAFKPYSMDPAHLTGNGRQWVLGGGLRAGIQLDLTSTLRFGLSAQTKMKMAKFTKYAGLFADGGAFDIPASATIGVAWDASKDVTVMLDYQRIWYSGIPSIANPFPNGMNPLGGVNGPGFGWKDVGVIKLGASWRSSPTMTWRFGYAYSTNPVQSSMVMLNILAPGVVRNHLSAGGSWKMNAHDTLDFSLEYVPTASVTGQEYLPGFGPNPASTLKLSMHQFAATVGWTRTF